MTRLGGGQRARRLVYLGVGEAPTVGHAGDGAMVRRMFEPQIDIAESESAAGGGAAVAVAEARPGTPSLAQRLAVAGDAAPPPATPRRRRRWPGDVLAVAFLCLVAVAATWPLALHPASTLADLGDPLDSAWRLTWPIHQLRHDPRHLLDANTYYPFDTTYLFDELLLGVALVVAPVILLTGNGVLAVNAALLIAFAMNGVGMYVLARHMTGSRVAALAGALVFAVAPFRFQHVGHVGLSTAFWLPLALLFLDRTVLRPTWRDAIIFGLCAALQALSAQYYGYQTAIVVALYLGWAAARRPQLLFDGRCLVRLLLAVVLAEALLLPIVAPYIAVKGTWGYSRGLEENELHSATASSFLAVPPGNPLGGRIAAAARGTLNVRAWNVWLYPGLGATLLALAGLARTRRRWSPPGATVERGVATPDLYGFCAILALCGAALCLGPVLYAQEIVRGEGLTRLMPYRALFAIIPGFDAMRAPERFGNMVLLGLGGATSFGVAGLLARLDRPQPRRRTGRARQALGGAGRFAAAALLLAIVGAEYVQQPRAVATVPPPPPVYAWLAAQPPGPVLELPLEMSAGEANREQLRQYWSTLHWQPRVNGSSDIAPRAYGALRRDLELFPDARTLGILQALDVRYVIVHRAQYPRAGWDTLAARYAPYGTTLQLRATFGDDLAYALQPDARFAGLQGLIPTGASVFLSDADPHDTDAYMATLGWLLRDGGRPIITKIIPTFGLRYTRPQAGQLADWAICYKGEDPTSYGYPPGMPVAYEDNVVRVYRRATR